jgi:hypothetical protein
MLSQLRKFNFFVFMLFVPTMAHADFVSGMVFADPGIGNSTPFHDGGHVITGGYSLQGCGSAPGATGCGAISVNYGRMGLSGLADNYFTVFVNGEFSDLITISAGQAAQGTTAMLTFSVGMEGDLRAQGLGSNSCFTLDAQVGTPFPDVPQINRRGCQFGNPAKGYLGDPLGIYSATVPIQIGVATPLDVKGGGTANAQLVSVSDSETASFDLMHTAFWGGIQQVTINGVPVNFTVTSQSGTNYSQSFQGLDSVPEPAGSWLLAAGVPLACWIRRRFERRRHQRNHFTVIGTDAT